MKVVAKSDVPLTSVEIVVNGRVAKSFEVQNPREIRGEADLEIVRGSWIAARCVARDGLLDKTELAAYSRGKLDTPYPIRPSTLRFAHTSPIYATVDGKGASVRSSIDEGLRMLDAFAVFARKTAAPAHRALMLRAVEEAREKLKRRLRE